jgi:hypothetical protein
VVALLFLALSGFEGMLMRSQQYNIDSLHGMEALLNNLRPGDVEPTTAELYYAMLSAHPIVGIFSFRISSKSRSNILSWWLPISGCRSSV